MYGTRNSVELDVQLPHIILHTVYNLGYRLPLRLRVRGMLFCRRGRSLLLRMRIAWS